MNEIKQGTLKILSNRVIDHQHSILSFENEGINPEAGQFIMIDCLSKKVRNNAYRNEDYLGPLLKRPFSFYLSSNDKDLSILYRIKGKGTERLPQLKPGDEVYYEGPLGKPIDIDKTCKKDETIHLIAGGVGIAVINFLAQKLIHQGHKVKIYFGVKELGKFSDYCLNSLYSIGLSEKDIMMSSEDTLYYTLHSKWDFSGDSEYAWMQQRFLRGVYIFTGNMIQALNSFWGFTIQQVKGPVFVCGPEPVMKYVHNFCAIRMKRDCYAFVERHLGCAKGVCCSCEVNGKLLCQEGSCMKSSEVF